MASKKTSKKSDKPDTNVRKKDAKKVSPRAISMYGGGQTGTPLTGMGTGDGRG